MPLARRRPPGLKRNFVQPFVLDEPEEVWAIRREHRWGCIRHVAQVTVGQTVAYLGGPQTASNVARPEWARVLAASSHRECRGGREGREGVPIRVLQLSKGFAGRSFVQSFAIGMGDASHP
jgi:hypothetical protein